MVEHDAGDFQRLGVDRQAGRRDEVGARDFAGDVAAVFVEVDRDDGEFEQRVLLPVEAAGFDVDDHGQVAAEAVGHAAAGQGFAAGLGDGRGFGLRHPDSLAARHGSQQHAFGVEVAEEGLPLVEEGGGVGGLRFHGEHSKELRPLSVVLASIVSSRAKASGRERREVDVAGGVAVEQERASFRGVRAGSRAPMRWTGQA